MHSFDLVDQPWIVSRSRDGTTAHLGLRATLVRAHELAEIVDPSPVNTVGLHRLLLAVLHRVFGPRNMDEWIELWQRGRWDDGALDAYFESQRSNLDLFGLERPFYQARGPLEGDSHPPARLAFERASGNNATLFDHSTRIDSRPMSPAEAARTLTGLQPFAIGGGVSTPFNLSDGPLARGFSILALGDTLFETLALNLLPSDAAHPIQSHADDCPIWEQADPATPNRAGTPPRGYLDYLTWQSRRVRLAADAEGRVISCQIMQNLSLPPNLVLDPFKCYSVDPDRGRQPRRFEDGRALWRDSRALFTTSDPSRLRPELFNWLARIDQERQDGAIVARSRYRFAALGVATPPGKANVVFWRHERLPLPLAYLDSPELLAALQRALEATESIGSLFAPGFDVDGVDERGRPRRRPRALEVVATILTSTAERQAARSAIVAMAERLGGRQAFWSRLEVAFRGFLVRLAEDVVETDDGRHYGEHAVPEWLRTVRHAAIDAFREITSSLEHTGRGHQARAQGEATLRRGLHRILAAATVDREEEVA